MLNIQELLSIIFVLVIIQSLIQYCPVLSKYNNDVKFNYYRSLMCLSFTIIGLNILTNHFTEGFRHPFSYSHEHMVEAYHLFFGYLIVDIIKMIALKNTRIDLYIHHILCIGSLIISHCVNKFGYIHCIILICEIISIISGIDSMAMNDNDKIISYKSKKFRKYIIKYVRIPIWIIALLFTIKHTNKISNYLWYNGIILSICMIYLDKYWENKCDKVINMYENENEK